MGGGAEPFCQTGGAQEHVKQTIKKFLWLELATVTSQALEYYVNNFCQHVQTILCKFNEPLTTPIYTTPYLCLLQSLEHINVTSCSY